MHNQKAKFNVLCFGSNNFNYSLKELKEYLVFNSLFIKDASKNLESDNYNIVLIDEDIIEDPKLIELISKVDNKITIFVGKASRKLNFKYDLNIEKPLSINELNKKVIKLIAGREFHKNSTIEIKSYILDKNEKKFRKNESFIYITEKEVKLLELLYSEKKPLSRKVILNKVWNYSSEADTHTVETHIYRLRKKILDKFNDSQLISNTKQGYSIWRKEIK